MDDHLEFSAERGEKPDNSYSGKFVFRIDPQLHRKLATLSSEEGASLNKWVEPKLAEH